MARLVGVIAEYRLRLILLELTPDAHGLFSSQILADLVDR